VKHSQPLLQQEQTHYHETAAGLTPRPFRLSRLFPRQVDYVSIAKGYGCDAARLDDLDAIKQAAATAWAKDRPTVLEIPISPQVPPLI